MLGRIRLQWWREVLEAVYAGAPARRHEVAVPLADAIRACSLDRAPFDRLLDARESDLEAEGPPDLAALERYAAATGGSLTALMLQASGVDSGPALEAGRQVGTAWALIGTLRAAPRSAAQGRVMLPARPPRRGRDQCGGCAGGAGVRPIRWRRRAGRAPRRRTAGSGTACAACGATAGPRRAADRAPRRSLPRPAPPGRVGPARSEPRRGLVAQAGGDARGRRHRALLTPALTPPPRGRPRASGRGRRARGRPSRPCARSWGAGLRAAGTGRN